MVLSEDEQSAATSYGYDRGVNKLFDPLVELPAARAVCHALLTHVIIPKSLTDYSGKVILDASARAGHHTYVFLNALGEILNRNNDQASISIVLNDRSYELQGKETQLARDAHHIIERMKNKQIFSGFQFETTAKNYLGMKPTDLSGKVALMIDRLGAFWHIRDWKEVDRYFATSRELSEPGTPIIVDAFNSNNRPRIGDGGPCSTYQHAKFNLAEQAGIKDFGGWLQDNHHISTKLLQIMGEGVGKLDSEICIWTIGS